VDPAGPPRRRPARTWFRDPAAGCGRRAGRGGAGRFRRAAAELGPPVPGRVPEGRWPLPQAPACVVHGRSRGAAPGRAPPALAAGRIQRAARRLGPLARTVLTRVLLAPGAVYDG